MYKIYENSLWSVFDEVLTKLAELRDKLKDEENIFPIEIHIPAISDIINEENILRSPDSEMDFGRPFKKDYYFKIWGLRYSMSHYSRAYDLVNNYLFEGGSFVTEKEYRIRYRSR